MHARNNNTNDLVFLLLVGCAQSFLRGVFDSVKKHVTARVRSDKDKMSARNQAVVLTHLPK